MRRILAGAVILVAVLVALRGRGSSERPSERAEIAQAQITTRTLVARAAEGPADQIAPPVAPASVVGPVAEPAKRTLTIAILRASADKVEVVDWADKSIPYTPAKRDSNVRWRIEDPTTGQVLEEGPLALPEVCACPIGHDHPKGCVLIHHQAVVRVNLPRVAPNERLRIVGPTGELGTRCMEVRS